MFLVQVYFEQGNDKGILGFLQGITILVSYTIRVKGIVINCGKNNVKSVVVPSICYKVLLYRIVNINEEDSEGEDYCSIGEGQKISFFSGTEGDRSIHGLAHNIRVGIGICLSDIIRVEVRHVENRQVVFLDEVEKDIYTRIQVQRGCTGCAMYHVEGPSGVCLLKEQATVVKDILVNFREDYDNVV